MIGHHEDDVAAEAATAPAEDQVIQAVAELGHHDQDALLGLVMEAELHLEAVGNGVELLLEPFRRVLGGTRECGAQVQRLAEPVVELLVLVDVEATFEEKSGDRWTIPARSTHDSVSTNFWALSFTRGSF